MNTHSRQPRSRPSTILMLAPTLLVLIGFYAFFYKSTNRQLQGRRGELKQFQASQPETQLQIQTWQNEIAQLHQDLEDARQEQVALGQQTDQLRGQQWALRQQMLLSTTQAETMNRVTKLLAEHRMAVVSNDSNAAPDPMILEENKQLANRLKLSQSSASAGERLSPNAMPVDANHDLARQSASDPFPYVTTIVGDRFREPLQPQQQHAVTVQGSFANLRKVTDAITNDFPGITIISIQLEKVDLRSATRNWKISLRL